MAERIETRRHFLKSLACGAVAVTTGCHALSRSSRSSRPNFVLVIGDDISVDDFGCYGHPHIRTPSIDALAAGGIRFTNAYLTASQCSPTRCSIISGRYPHNTGAPELHMPLEAEGSRLLYGCRRQMAHGPPPQGRFYSQTTGGRSGCRGELGDLPS